MPSARGSYVHLADMSQDQEEDGDHAAGPSHREDTRTPTQELGDLSTDDEESGGAAEGDGEDAAGEEAALQDIADFAAKRPLHSRLKTVAIEKFKTKRCPDKSFEFPLTTKGGVKRKFNRSYCEDHHWLIYSEKNDSLYCLPCVLFAVAGAGGGPRGLGVGRGNVNQVTFVNEGYKNWKKVREDMRVHENTSYHRGAVTRMAAFLDVLKTDRSIDHELSEQYEKEQVARRAK